jgi:hypothetical protein
MTSTTIVCCRAAVPECVTRLHPSGGRLVSVLVPVLQTYYEFLPKALYKDER